MQEADLYLNKVDLCRYWPANAVISCEDFIARRSKEKGNIEDYPFLTRRQKQAFKLVLEANTYLPPVPQMTMPQPTQKGLVSLNDPDETSLLIVTSNNQQTFEVLTTIWDQGATPAYFLLVDCLGSTVDMAVIFGDFTPERLAQMVRESRLESIVKHRHMIVPGFTAALADDFAVATDWEVEVGPVCAMELPLFLGDRWMFSEKQR